MSTRICSQAQRRAEELDEMIQAVHRRGKGRPETPIRIDGVWTANVFRLYLDTRRDRRRGSEHSDHLRREVIGF